MADSRITGLPALPSNTDLILPLTALSIATLPLATTQNVANNQATVYQWWSNGEVLFQSTVQNLKTLAAINLAVPAGFRFFIEECFIVATTISALSAQPVVSFGNGTDAVKYVNNVTCTLLTATNTRERFGVNGSDGETALTAVVNTIAAGTTVSGRFGFRGILFPL